MEMLYTCSLESVKAFIEGFEKWKRNGQVIHPELDEKYRRIDTTPAFRIVFAEVSMLQKMNVIPAVPDTDQENISAYYHDIICWCRRYYNGKQFDVRF